MYAEKDFRLHSKDLHLKVLRSYTQYENKSLSLEDVDIMYAEKDFRLHIKEMTQGFAIIHTV